MAKSPLVVVKEKFGDKAGLVSAVEKLASEDLWLGRTNKDKGLAHVSNSKLLRLHQIFTDVKAKFGSRAKLIDAILEVEKRTKDAGYRTRLEGHPVPRLWDQFRSAEKRQKAASAPKAPAKKKAAPAPAPAPAKKASGRSSKTTKAAAPAAPAKPAKKAAAKKSGK